MLCSTLRTVAVATTARQEIKDYCFQMDSRIGLEVEMSYNRLVCCKVYPDTQAAQYEVALDGAEVLAINGKRVLSLDDFRSEMDLAKEGATVLIKMASYVNGFTKHDDIFHDAKRNKAMKSLLSNMLQMNSQDNREDQRNFDLHDLDEDDDELDLKEEDRALRDAEDTVSAVTAASGTCTASVSVEQALDESSYLLQEKDTSRDRSRSRGWSDDRERLWEADVEGEQLLAGKKQPASWRESDHESQTTVRSIPLPPEGSLSKGASVAEKSKQWNYATASNAALTPFLSLVCMPRVLRRSEAWGRPTSFLQVTNFSSQWLVEVNWVDEDGCLVPRCALPNGKTHIERCSSEHVWVLTALRTASKTAYRGGGGSQSVAASSVDSLQEESMTTLANTNTNSTSLAGDGSAAPGAVVMVLRPALSALQPYKYNIIYFSALFLKPRICFIADARQCYGLRKLQYLCRKGCIQKVLKWLRYQPACL
mmetsp:Transcript_18961/g.25921  ORF Transcript_18961/g.25921 Transcript_18961/m.25921 type:complete len:480 (-) Transcript_18961:321-1760(-)